MASLTETQIITIEKYWGLIDNLKNDIRREEIRYAELFNTYDGYGNYSQLENSERKMDRMKEQLHELVTSYEKWLLHKVGLRLKDQTQDHTTYNIVNNIR